MNWYPYYQLFIRLNNTFRELRKKDSITFTYPNTSRFAVDVNTLLQKTVAIQDELKRRFEDQLIEGKNPYLLLEQELKAIIKRFSNNEFQIEVTANNKSKGNHPFLLRYKLEKFIDDLSVGELDTDDGGEALFIYIYAYVEYWNWLHQQKPTFKYFSLWRQIETYNLSYEQEELTNIILQIFPSPFAVVQELKLFFATLDSTIVATLVDYAKDKAYRLYVNGEFNQKNRLKPMFHTVECSPKKDKDLERFYNEIEKYLNHIAPSPLQETPTIGNNSTAQSPMLIWNGTKGTLIDLFLQLKNTTIQDKKGNLVPLLGNSNIDIAQFIIDNFNTHQNTKLSTVKGQIDGRKRPQKTANRITLRLGDSTE